MRGSRDVRCPNPLCHTRLPSRVRFAPTFRFCPTCRTALRNDWAWGALLCALLALAPALRLWAGIAALLGGLVGWRRARPAAGRGQWLAGAALGLGGILVVIVVLPPGIAWFEVHWQLLQARQRVEQQRLADQRQRAEAAWSQQDEAARQRAEARRHEEEVRTHQALQSIQLAPQDAKPIGDKIWRNESAQKKVEELVTWKPGESFASMGIGHFIWYPRGSRGPFEETFPDLLEFLQVHGITLPGWLQNRPACPWQTRQEFLQQTQDDQLIALRQLMLETIELQVRFIIRRLEQALPAMLATLSTDRERAHIREQFSRVAQTPQGVYALIDYAHFKGWGTSPTERYNGYGWGLLQVLVHMSGESPQAVREFAEAAEAVLERRVKHAPAEKNEARWLPGWKNRLRTYRP